MKTNTKLVVGILSGLFVIGFIILWDLVIKEQIESVDVVVVSPGAVIHRNETIKEEHLIVEKRNKSTIIEGFIKPENIGEIVGKKAQQDLVGNQLLSLRFIELDGITVDPEKGEAIRPIPNSWLYALPNTLRRKDNIDVYLVPNEELRKKKETETQNVTFVGLSPEQEVANEQEQIDKTGQDKQFEEERNAIADDKNIKVKSYLGKYEDVEAFQKDRKAFLEERGLSEETWNELVKKGELPLLVDIPVMYVKDGTGNEILSAANGVDKSGLKEQEEQRLTSTGTIVNLEVLLDEDNHRILMSYVNEGYQLYITYN